MLVRKQGENAEDNVRALEAQVAELVAQLDACRAQCSQYAQDREMLQKSLDSSKSERGILDRSRAELNTLVTQFLIHSVFNVPTRKTHNQDGVSKINVLSANKNLFSKEINCTKKICVCVS